MAQRSKITGAAELEKVLKKLPDRVAKKVVFGALRAGAGVIRREAKRLAPVASGLLKKEIRIFRPGKRSDTKRVKGLNTGSNLLIGTSGRAPHGHLVEFGTHEMAAQPFLRPALDHQAGHALARMGQILGKGVEREARRLAGPYAKSGLKRRR